MRGDLHCHTKLSDGSQGIEYVIAAAKRARLDFLAITDHDTTASFSRSKVLGERYGVQVIQGVEFSSCDETRGRKVHILCYLPEKPDRLQALCMRTTEARKKAGSQMLQMVMRKYPISASEVVRLAGGECIYKQHIMHALMNAGYTTEIYGELFHKLFDPGEKSCLVQIEYPGCRDVIDLIHSAGGLAVLAHPRVYDSFDLAQELIAEKRLDGIEVWHPRNQEGDSARLLSLTKEHGLLSTGGSDFHGMYASQPAEIGRCYTPKSYLDELFVRKDSMK